MEKPLEMRLGRKEVFALVGTSIGLMFLTSAVAAWSGYMLGRAEETYQTQKALPQAQEYQYDSMNRQRGK